MGRFLCLNFSFSDGKSFRTFLAVSWIAGLIFGGSLSSFSDIHFFSLMLSASDCRLSIVPFLSVLLLPLLITIVSVYLDQIYILLLLVFFKGALFMFVGWNLLGSFDSSGWLIRCLLMFSSSFTLPAYWFLWLRASSTSHSSWKRLSVPAAVLIVSVGCFDYVVVAPFLTHLISQ